MFTGSPAGFLVDSTLVAGDKDAILIDGQFDLADAHRLVAMILDSKKHLTTVDVTHFHPDHDEAGAIDATRAYLDAFDAAVASSKTSAEAQKKVKAKYPTAQLDIILQLGADAAFPAK